VFGREVWANAVVARRMLICVCVVIEFSRGIAGVISFLCVVLLAGLKKIMTTGQVIAFRNQSAHTKTACFVLYSLTLFRKRFNLFTRERVSTFIGPYALAPDTRNTTCRSPGPPCSLFSHPSAT